MPDVPALIAKWEALASAAHDLSRGEAREMPKLAEIVKLGQQEAYVLLVRRAEQQKAAAEASQAGQAVADAEDLPVQLNPASYVD